MGHFCSKNQVNRLSQQVTETFLSISLQIDQLFNSDITYQLIYAMKNDIR